MSKLLNDKEASLIKSCLCYDGTDESIENELWAVMKSIGHMRVSQTNDQAFQWDVKVFIMVLAKNEVLGRYVRQERFL